MGLVETWIESKGCGGRVKQLQTTFEPAWVQEVRSTYIDQSPMLDHSSDSV